MAVLVAGYTAAVTIDAWMQGTKVSWTGMLLFVAIVGALPAAAFYAGMRGHYGRSVLIGAVAVTFLLFVAGLNLAIATS